MDHPKITIVTPSFNQGEFIEKTIDSVLSQGYPNLEFIIIDGGSKDNTVEVIKRYSHHLSFWVSEQDRGQSHAINKGMARSTGHYLTWLNSDDWYTPDALNKFRAMAGRYPEAGMIVGTGRIVNQTGKVVYHKEPTNPITLETLLRWFDGGSFVQPSSIFSRAAWERCGPLDENEHIAMDLDLWLKIALAGFQFATTEELLSEALSHPAAKTTEFESLMRVEGLLVIARHGGLEKLKAGMLHMSNEIDNLTKRLEWYQRNYEILINHPLSKFMQPIIKKLSKEGRYWQSKAPPWVKG